MENQATLHFYWDGDDRGSDDFKLKVFVDDNEVAIMDYQDAAEVEIPLILSSYSSSSDNDIELKLKVAKDGGRQFTHFKRSFKVMHGKHYACSVDGSIKDTSGFGVRFCEGHSVEDETPKLSGLKSSVAMWSVLCPVYGLYKAITDTYMRTTALIGGATGFLLGIITSSMADKGDSIALGLSSLKLIEYKPFSLTDFIINFLVGGISSLNGLLRMLLDNVFG